jgi:hypothetical protein
LATAARRNVAAFQDVQQEVDRAERLTERSRELLWFAKQMSQIVTIKCARMRLLIRDLHYPQSVPKPEDLH